MMTRIRGAVLHLKTSYITMTTTELIIKGSILGIGLFFAARVIYYKGFWVGANWAKDYIFNELKKKK